MFERYTERARRAIVFARYEASSFGSSYIEPEHLLLGILREDQTLWELIGGTKGAEDIRKQIEAYSGPAKTPVPATVDMPVSQTLKRILAYGAQKSEGLTKGRIETLHLTLGILNEPESFAASLLNNAAINAEKLTTAGASAGPAYMRFHFSLFQPLCDLAEDEAHMLNRLPGPEHMLLALLRSEHGLAAKILKERGFTLEELRTEIRRRYLSE